MKTFLILCIAMVLHTTVDANTSSRRDIKPSDDIIVRTYNIPSSKFNKIEVSNAANVSITEGEGDIVVNIDSNLAEYLVVELDGDELEIKLDCKHKLKKKFTFDVMIPHNGQLSELSASGKSSITSQVVLTGDDIEIDASGMSNILAMVRGGECEIKSSGMSDVEVAGQCNTFEIKASGMSSIEAYINGDECIADSSGMSDILIEGEYDRIEALASGMSDITIKGVANIAKLSASGMSDISASKLKYKSISTSKSGMSDVSFDR